MIEQKFIFLLRVKYRDHLLIAEDGTYMEIPYNVYNINDFQFCMNQHVHDIFDVKKAKGVSEYGAGLNEKLINKPLVTS